MNMTDEILNSWTDADEFVGAKTDKITNAMEKTFSKTTTTSTGERYYKLENNRCYLLVIQSVSLGEIYSIYNLNGTIRIAKIASNISTSVWTVTNDGETLIVNTQTAWAIDNLIMLNPLA